MRITGGRKKIRIGDLLVEAGAITEEELQEALAYQIEKNCPVVNRINPGTLIVNGFKSLSVYGDSRRYVVNMVTLASIGILCMIISVWKLRRTRYESI